MKLANGEMRIAVIQFAENEGSIHAFSDDIPGLNICGRDHATVLRDVLDGIKFIYREFFGQNVAVELGKAPDIAIQHQMIERLVMRQTA